MTSYSDKCQSPTYVLHGGESTFNGNFPYSWKKQDCGMKSDALINTDPSHGIDALRDTLYNITISSKCIQTSSPKVGEIRIIQRAPTQWKERSFNKCKSWYMWWYMWIHKCVFILWTKCTWNVALYWRLSADWVSGFWDETLGCWPVSHIMWFPETRTWKYAVS